MKLIPAILLIFVLLAVLLYSFNILTVSTSTELVPESEYQPLYSALRNGDTQLFIKILNENPDTINKYRADGTTPIYQAIYFGRIKELDILLERGADVNLRERIGEIDNGNTPLHLAILSDNFEAAKLIMKYQPNIALKNFEDQSAYDLAKEKGGEFLSLFKKD